MVKQISHIGIAVEDLDRSEALFRTLLGVEEVHRETVTDQQVAIASFRVGTSLIELTAPTTPESPIRKYLDERGEGIHHIAFEVEDLPTELERIRAEGLRLIDESPRRGAHDMLIAFLHPKSTNRVLIELCQHPENS